MTMQTKDAAADKSPTTAQIAAESGTWTVDGTQNKAAQDRSADREMDRRDAFAPPAPNVTVVMQQDDRAGQAARAMADGKALEMDTTVPGGRYQVAGEWVDANGNPAKG